jgi:hypothetical protein
MSLLIMGTSEEWREEKRNWQSHPNAGSGPLASLEDPEGASG